MRTLSFAVVIATVTVAHADPLEDHLQALRGYGVSGPHDATALIARSITVREWSACERMPTELHAKPARNGLARSDRSGRHASDDYMGLSSFAPKYDPADWGTDPTSPVLYNGGAPTAGSSLAAPGGLPTSTERASRAKRVEDCWNH